MAWYPCCCCPAGDRVLIWRGEAALDYSGLASFYEAMGLTADTDTWTEDLSDYGLIFGFDLTEDPPWWDDLAAWAGTCLLACDNDAFGDDPAVLWLDSKSATTGVSIDANSYFLIEYATIASDPLTSGVTKFAVGNASNPVGGTTLFSVFGLPVIVRSQPGDVLFVISGDEAWPATELGPLGSDLGPFLENLYSQRPRPDCTPRVDNIGATIGGAEFGFTTAALVGLGALESEEVTATFTVGGVLTVLGTLEQIAGTTTLDFTATADADGLTTCSGTTTLTHTCTADLNGSGVLDGECNVVFSTSCAIHGFGRLLGQSNWAFSTLGDVSGVLELTGSTALQFTTIGHLATDSPIAGSTTLSFFNVTGDLNGVLELTGNTSAQFTTSADLNGELELTGDTSIQFTTLANVSGELEMTADTALQFTTSADLNGELEITGNTSVQFTTSAALGLDALITGGTSLSFFNVSGDLNGELELTGNTSVQFTTSALGSVNAEADASGNTGLTFSTQGDVNGELEITGGTDLQFTTSGAGALRGRLVGNSQMTFSTSGALTDIGGGGGFCEHCSGSFPTEKVVRLCGTVTNSGCGICATIRGDFTLTSDTISEQDCLLEYNDPSFPCGTLNMQLRFFATEISFDISIGSLSGSSQFKRTGLSAPYNCLTAVDGSYTLSFDSSSECTFSGMTVVVNPPQPSCTHCSTGTTPETLTLIFGSGFANNNCEDCNLLGNTFVLTRDGPCDNACRYTYTGSSACGDVVIELILGSSSITGTIEIDGQNHANLSASVSAPYDCSALRNLTVSGIPGNMACDLTGITSATIEG